MATTQPPIAMPSVFAGYGQFTPSRIIIASIYPEAVEKTMVHNGFRVYRIEACSDPKKPNVLDVYDTQTWIRNWYTQDENSPSELQPAPIRASDIANDLVHHWTADTLGTQGRPGIWICKGPVPTEEEIKENLDIQTVFFRSLVNDGQTLFNKGEVKNISDLHRLGARWLKVRVPWLVELERAEDKPCPNCREKIDAQALGCKHCHIDLVKFYMEREYLDYRSDPVVASIVNAKGLKTTPSAPVSHIEPPLRPNEAKK